MNIFLEELSKISPNCFGFLAVSEYIVCVSPYLRSVPPKSDCGYIDEYYTISNSQYHQTRKFTDFCKKFGCVVAPEKEKSYKDFLHENGFFNRGKNSLLQDVEFGSKIYLTVLKVAEIPKTSETFGDKFGNFEDCEKYFEGLGYSAEDVANIAKAGVRLSFVKFLQALKSKVARFKKTAEDPCKNCNICVNACPQNAIPCKLENCLRYHMQEGEVEASYSEKLENRILGCEICSEVCPKNRKLPMREDESLELSELLILTQRKDKSLTDKYGRNIISKNKLTAYIINAMGNSRDVRYLPIIKEYQTNENEKIKIACEIAVAKLGEVEIEQ